jgi:hypothetical protein
MRYVITESRIEEAITDYLDELFDIENLNWTHPYDYDDETGEEGEDENRVEFYIGDYLGFVTISHLIVLLETYVQPFRLSLNIQGF